MRFWCFRGTHQFNCGYFRRDLNLYERACGCCRSGNVGDTEVGTGLVARTDTGCAVYGQVGCVVPGDLTDRTCPWPIPVLGVCVGRRL